MDIQKQIEIGVPIFNTLFNTKREVLIDIVKRMVDHHKGASQVFDDTIRIQKIIMDDKPEKLFFVSWNKIEISPLGVYYYPEHGAPEKVVVFNEFFKLDM